ncbi:MAG TPA: helix-turn-helix domain-containing protein, partial [Rugosimonospora sp.]|nr:helix-turn-helix domain-containing protein [Rugosimonospora sp.]
MPTHRDPDRRDRLAAAAAELIRTRGYHAVGVNEIGAAAGVSGPAVYRHFPDKQALLAHVLLGGVAEMHASTMAALATPGVTGPGRIEAVLASAASGCLERREVTALWRYEGRHLSRPQQREIGRRSRA